MQIDAYFSSLRTTLHSSALIAATDIQEDARTPHEGFVKGRVKFIDGSFLSFREYVNTSSEDVVRYAYSFHYQKELQLIFRYDNTPHYPLLSSFPHHKHTSTGDVIPSVSPTLEDVIREIESHLRKFLM